MFFIGSGAIKSQNLVPNHDFTDVITCDEDPNLGIMNDYLQEWFNPPNKSDSIDQMYLRMIHPCTKTAMAGTSTSTWNSFYPGFSFEKHLMCDKRMLVNFPQPKEGLGYIVLNTLDTVQLKFMAYSYPWPNCNGSDSVFIDRTLFRTDYRSFSTVMLRSPLDSGVDYVFESHIRLERNGPKFVNPTYSIKGLGAHLTSDTLFAGDYISKDIKPTFESSKFIENTDNWYKMVESFIADGSEQFLTLGHFAKSSKALFRMLPVDTNPFVSLINSNYYFDAIYLYKSTDTLFNLSLPSDTSLCPGESLTLRPELDDGFKLKDTTKTWLWSTGSTDSSITVSQPGTYWVTVTYNDRWRDSDTLVIHPYNAYQSDLPMDTLVCEEKDFSLRVPVHPDINFRWNTGNRQFRQEVFPPGGWYWITYEDECGIHHDSTYVEFQTCDTNQAPVLYIPNSFSPNGDGLNDQWSITNLPKDNEVWLFNRWGELVFKQKNYDGSWDGLGSNGEALRSGTYIYKIRYKYYPGITGEEGGWLKIIR